MPLPPADPRPLGSTVMSSTMLQQLTTLTQKSATQSVPSSEQLQTLMYITSSGKFGVFRLTIVMNGFMKEVAPRPCSPLGATFPVHFRLFKHRLALFAH